MTQLAALGLLSGADGVWTVDVTDPTAPAALGSFDLAYVQDVRWWGDYILARPEGSSSLYVIDASDPSVLTLAGSVVVSGDFAGAGKIRALNATQVVVTAGDATASGDGALYVFDLTDPTAPSLVGTYDFTSDIDGFLRPWGLAIVGTTAVVGSGTSPNLITIDLSDPATPSRGTFYNDITSGEGTNVYGVEPLDSSTLAVIFGAAASGPNGSGLWLADSSTLAVVGSVTSDDHFAVARPEGLSVTSDGLLVGLACPQPNQITFVDVSVPASPVVFGQMNSPTELDLAYSPDFTNDDAYLCVPALGDGNFAVVSVAASPAVAGNLTGFPAFSPYVVHIKPPSAALDVPTLAVPGLAIPYRGVDDAIRRDLR